MFILDEKLASVGTVIKYDTTAILNGEINRFITESRILEIITPNEYRMEYLDRPGVLVHRKIIPLGNINDVPFITENSVLLTIDITTVDNPTYRKIMSATIENKDVHIDPFSVNILISGCDTVFNVVTKETIITEE